MTMHTIPANGIQLIKEFEGCHKRIGDGLYRAYPDPATGGEPWTIGWGTTRNVYNEPIKQGDTATQDQVNRYLLSECDAGMIILDEIIPWWDEMSDDQQGALLSFGYNLGWHFYSSSGFDTITRELQRRHWNPGVPEAMKLYNKGGGQTMPGLVRRRQAEADLWLQGLNNAQPPSPPPMTEPTYTLGDFYNTYTYWDASQHHKNAVKFLYDATAVEHRKIYFDKYRTPAEPPPEPTPPPADSIVIIEGVPYFNQRDNPSAQGDRECFATSCAMAAVYHGACTSENQYLNKFPYYGDSTDPNAHLRTLQHFGLNAKFITTGSTDDLRAEVDKGRPTPCGWLHHGTPSAPSGGGHYGCVVGYDPESEAWIVHDPYGDPNLVSGGWLHYNSTAAGGTVYGQHLRFSYRNWNPRWSVADSTDGWYMRIWA